MLILMKRKLFLITLLLTSFFYISCGKDENSKVEKPPVENPGQTNEEKIVQANWKTTQVSDAIVWKYFHFPSLFSAKQSVTVFDIDLNNQKLKIDFPYVSSGFLKTSEGGASVRAAAAINGGYFDTSTGGSTVFFKKNGQLITPTRSGFTSDKENAGMAVDADGKGSNIKNPSGGWGSAPEHSPLGSGPLPRQDGKSVDPVN